MHDHTDRDSRSPPPFGSVVTRAQPGPGNDTAQPSLTSGFGAVIDKEHDLQDATEESFGQASGHRSAEIDRILHHQHARIGANIALLEQRYEALPSPRRFASWCDRARPPAEPRRTRRDDPELLPELIARHTSLLADITALIGCAPDGQRGELILAEVSRNHAAMAWALAALIDAGETTAQLVNDRPAPASNSTRLAQENWDNEGGLVRANPPAS